MFALVASGINPVEDKENQKKAKNDEYENRVLFKHVAAEYNFLVFFIFDWIYAACY
jgi:hypothetical protein